MTVSEFINKVGFQVKNEDVNKVNSTISSIKNNATKLLGAIGIGFSLAKLNAIAEEFDGIGDRIECAAGEAENVDEIMNKILDSANASRTALGQFTNEVTNLKQANEEVFPLEEAATFVEYVNKLGKAAGYSDGEISTMQNSIQRIVASGEMAEADLKRIGRQTPALITTICDGLGVTREELDSMAASGTLTAETLKTAMLNSTDQIDKAFSKLNFGVSDALLHIRNRWGFWVNETNKMFGITNGIGNLMVKVFNGVMKVLDKVRNGVVWVSEKVGGANNLLKLLAITAGSLFLVFNFQKIIAGFKALMTAVGGLNLKLLAIAAVIIIVALLVEDFINFMQGNDSLLGAMLEKLGIDCDAVRQTIIDAWSQIKEKLAVLWESLKEAGSMVWERIKEAAVSIFNALEAFWDKWGDTITNTFSTLFSLWKDYFNGFLDVIIGIVDFIGAIFAGDWEGAWQAICDIFVGLWNMMYAYIQMIWEWIKLIFQIALDFILGVWTAIWTGISEFFISIWNSIVSFIQGIWNTITSTISGFLSTIWNNITSTFTNIWNSITSTISGIKDTIVEGFNAAVSFITSLPSQAFQWGKDIIMSIVNGIKSCIGAVGDAVSGVAGKIKSFLHFSEPDEGPLSDFHTYMPDMIDLMAKGINNGKEKVKGALGGLTGEMAVMARADMVASSTASAVQGSNNVSKSVVQKVEINNEFNGDAAIQRSASSAMDKSATDVTAQLARGLAYAR